MKKFTVSGASIPGILVLFASLFVQTATAADPHYFRELERQTKTDQARASQRRRLENEAIVRTASTSVSVDAYRFELQLLPAEARLSGTVTLDLVAGAPTREVVLDALDPVITKVWFTDALGVRSETRYERAANSVRVALPVEVPASTRFSLTLAYSVVGDRRDGRSGETERGLFFVNADGAHAEPTPTVYTSVEPQLARSWYPCIDDPTYKAARSVMQVTAPEGWVVVSNGALKGVQAHPESKTSTYLWEEGFPIPTYLISLAAAPYVVIEDRLGSLPVQYFVPKSLESKARAGFARTPQMIEYFSKLWMPYPFEKYAMATVPLYSGAMEHTTATTMSDAMVDGNAECEETVAHELAHHWWGDTVTPADWDQLWLNEGWATFSELLFAEKFRGADAALEDLFADQASYFHFDPEGMAAVVDPKTSPDEKFTPAVYEKGAWIMHMLRATLGENAFFAASNAFLKKFAFHNASTEDFRRALEEVSRVDLTSFFKQWIYGPGYPELSVKWSYDKTSRQLSITVEQGKHLFAIPLELLVASGDPQGKLAELPLRLELSEAKQVFTQTLPAGFPEPKGMVIDPTVKLLKKLSVERKIDELRFWLETGSTSPQASFPVWVARLQAVESMMSGRSDAAVIHELLAHLERESSAPVRARMYEVLAAGRRLKDLKDVDLDAVRRAIPAGLSDREIEVRVAAAAAARAYIAPALAETVLTRFTEEQSVRAKAGLALALAESRHARAFELFLAELQKSAAISGHRRLLQAILESFGILGDRRAAAILEEHVNGANPYLQTVALESLGMLAVPETFNLIKTILEDEARSIELRVSSTRALANFGGIAAARALSAQLEGEKNVQLRQAIKTALERLGGLRSFRDLSVQGSPALLQW